MTLYKQLSISIVMLFVLGFLGTVITSTNTMRHFMATQLESHAQDTATSLGLSLSPHMGTRDMPIINSMIDAIFDRGDYRKITVIAIDGVPLVERISRLDSRHAPDWFVNAVDLHAPTAEALIMSGWKQAATVYVTSNLDNAHNELWSNTVDTFLLFLVFALVILAIGLIALKMLLRPLHRVELQAAAICNQEYPVQKRLPRTRELRRVVLAMNQLSSRVNESFAKQSRLTKNMQIQAYMDPVTGLGNRRYFDRQLQNTVGKREDTTHGALLIIELKILSSVNSATGYSAGDQLLHRAGELLKSTLKESPKCLAARISGAGFGVIATGIDADDAESLAHSISDNFMQLRADGLAEADEIVHIGIAMWAPGSTVPTLLSEADAALCAAQSLGKNAWKRYEPNINGHIEKPGVDHWRGFLRQVINEGKVTGCIQPVYGLGENRLAKLQEEFLLRISDMDGNTLSAGAFMPMAERVGLASELDRLAVDATLAHLDSRPDDPTPCAVNLSSASLYDPVFLQWLCARLAASPGRSHRILVEFPEYSVLKNIMHVRKFIERLAAQGCRCGIDHFGRGFSSYGYLRSLKIDYLKIDGSYIGNIGAEEDNQFFIQSLTDTAHSIGIMVIAQSVETDAELDTLASMKLDGIQGYLAGKPEALLMRPVHGSSKND
ncbi:MAG: EAL domain-containing protein [Gammaproteobacteria bacterium]